MHWSWLLLLLGGVCAFDYNVDQTHRLLEITPKSRKDVETLMTFEYPVDFWGKPRVGHKSEIFVETEYFGLLKSYLYANAMTFKISDRDLSAELKAEWEGLVARGRLNRVYDINDYNTLEDINNEVDRLSASCPTYGLTCFVEEFGTTVEGRPLRQIRISSGNANQLIMVDSLIHAREWLAGATVMNILDKVITGYGTDSDVTNILNTFDLVFIPVMNPDGYSYTWSDFRFWRKNRCDHPESNCTGTDLNRNFDFGWGRPGAGNNTCADDYRGAFAASEPETVAIQNFVGSLSPVPIAGLAFHVYGYLWLSAFGDGTYPPFIADVDQVTAATCAAIEATFGNETWACGNSYEEFYLTSGTAMDWYTGVGNIKYSYTPELRDEGQGFTPPPSAIARSFEEIWNGFVAMVDEIIAIEGF